MIMLQTGALDTLRPMHIVVRHDAIIEATGPTIAKLGFQGPLAGLSLFEAFEVLRPAGAKTLSELSGQEARALKLRSKHGEPIEFKASFAPLGEDGGAVLNLSFGISMLDAIGRFNLTQADFSATDMTVEMLFLAETKSLAMREWRKMTERLSSAKSQAERHANTDALTGIGNRRALDRIVQDLISQRLWVGARGSRPFQTGK